jgi:hypothetical protein
MSALPKCELPKRLQPWAERSKEWIKTPCGWLGCALVVILIAWAAKPVGKDWVDVLRALATPAIAYAGYSIASRGLQIQRQKRTDDLFDKRYEFYQKCLAAIPWRGETYFFPTPQSGYWSGPEDDEKTLEKIRAFYRSRDRIKSLADESLFIFGEDVKEHLMNCYDKIHEAMCKIDDTDRRLIGAEAPRFLKFDEPFRRYMRLR